MPSNRVKWTRNSVTTIHDTHSTHDGPRKARTWCKIHPLRPSPSVVPTDRVTLLEMLDQSSHTRNVHSSDFVIRTKATERYLPPHIPLALDCSLAFAIVLRNSHFNLPSHAISYLAHPLVAPLHECVLSYSYHTARAQLHARKSFASHIPA